MYKITRLLMLALFSLTAIMAFADDSNVPVSTCKSYLQESDSDFQSDMTSKQSSAKTISDNLAQCLRANACTDIDGIEDCSALLSSRAFTSNYYANKAGSSSSSSVSAVAPTSDEATSSSTTSSSSTPADSSTTTNTTTSSDTINW